MAVPAPSPPPGAAVSPRPLASPSVRTEDNHSPWTLVSLSKSPGHPRFSVQSHREIGHRPVRGPWALQACLAGVEASYPQSSMSPAEDTWVPEPWHRGHLSSMVTGLPVPQAPTSLHAAVPGALWGQNSTCSCPSQPWPAGSTWVVSGQGPPVLCPCLLGRSLARAATLKGHRQSPGKVAEKSSQLASFL